VQADVAAQALAGQGPFAQGGPLTTLRALGSLFPEAVHLVVLPDSPIKAVEDLRGKRVDIGAPQSGTRASALALLAAHGVAVADLREAGQGSPERAVRRLVAGQLDAFFVTIAPPAHSLQELAAKWGLRLVGLRPDAVTRLVGERSGLVTMTIPPNPSPGQGEPVATGATAALLVTPADSPDGEVEKIVGVAHGGANLGRGQRRGREGLQGQRAPGHHDSLAPGREPRADEEALTCDADKELSGVSREGAARRAGGGAARARRL
jgi:TRAP transporter TAXI family solute receptor